MQFRSHRGLRGSLHQLRLLCLGLAVVRAAARAAVAAVLLLGVQEPGEGAVRVRALGLVQLGAAARAVQDLGLPGVQELLPHSRTRLRPVQRNVIFSFLFPHNIHLNISVTARMGSAAREVRVMAQPSTWHQAG